MSDRVIGNADGRTNPLAERLFKSALGVLDLLTVYLGDRLGLYQALAERPATSAELADRTGTFERYVREWLEQQAVSGFLEVDDPDTGPESRRYRIPEEHLDVLVNRDNLSYEAHKGIDMVRAARPMPDLVEAFRTGAGLPPLPWEPEGRAEFNRSRFLNLLGKRWLPAIGPLHHRLLSDPPARVADLGCGTGWSSIAMALAYPKVSVVGFDLDEAVVAAAKQNADSSGVPDRVSFHARDAGELEASAGFDLVTVFEALHDMSLPAEALRAMRGLLAGEGRVLIADERVGDRFAVPADEQERYAYGWSVVSCLPSAMGVPGAAGTGAVMRPDTLRRYAEEAGFTTMDILPIEDVEWRFYLLAP
jgi:2-polyprenyl-3-methyl-5-hydroxy-6-metoxy-1,4-benzoquinol methylase